MSALPWFKCNPQDLLDGLLGLESEEQGPYMTVLSLIYIRGGAIPDDARWLAGNCRLSVRRWNVVRASLIVKGKLYITADGALMNGRAAKEIGCSGDNPEIISGSPGDKVEAPESDAKENKDLSALDRDRELEKKGPKGPSRRSGDAPPVKMAFSEWNALAERLGLPVAKTLDRQRRERIAVRLRTGGGIEGWREALAAVEASPHCRGDNERGWRADLDFVCQPKSFNKLREGSYAAPEKPGVATPSAVPPWPGPKAVRDAIKAERGEGFVRSYLDPCGWDEGESVIAARHSFAADKLSKDCGGTLRRFGLRVTCSPQETGIAA